MAARRAKGARPPPARPRSLRQARRVRRDGRRSVCEQEIPGADRNHDEQRRDPGRERRAPSASSARAASPRRGLRLRRLADFERIGPDRLGDVLELGRAEVGDGQIEPPLHLAIGVLGQADRARLGDAFQSRGDIDPVAHQVAVALLDDVAQMNADAEHDALVRRRRRCARPWRSALRSRNAPRRRRCGTRRSSRRRCA